MRIIFICLLFCTNGILAQNKIYDIEMRAIDSNNISLKNYTGNKMLFVLTALDNLEKGQLGMLDSIQDKYPAVKVIVIPSRGTVSEKDQQITQSLKNNAVKRSVFFAPTSVAKDKLSEKNPIIKYLTDVKENGHFDVDIKSDFMMFIVSESGILYAVLERLPNEKQLDKLLTQKDIAQ